MAPRSLSSSSASRQTRFLLLGLEPGDTLVAGRQGARLFLDIATTDHRRSRFFLEASRGPTCPPELALGEAQPFEGVLERGLPLAGAASHFAEPLFRRRGAGFGLAQPLAQAVGLFAGPRNLGQRGPHLPFARPPETGGEPVGNRRHLVRRPAGQCHHRLVGFRESPSKLGNLRVEAGAILGSALQPSPQFFDSVALCPRHPHGRGGLGGRFIQLATQLGHGRVWQRSRRGLRLGGAYRLPSRRQRAPRQLHERVAQPGHRVPATHRHVNRRRFGPRLHQASVHAQAVHGALELDQAKPQKRRHAEHLHARKVMPHRVVQVVVTHAIRQSGAFRVGDRHHHASLGPQQAPPPGDRPGPHDLRLGLGHQHQVKRSLDSSEIRVCRHHPGGTETEQVLGAGLTDATDLEDAAPDNDGLEVGVKRQAAVQIRVGRGPAVRAASPGIPPERGGFRLLASPSAGSEIDRLPTWSAGLYTGRSPEAPTCIRARRPL